MTDTSLLRSQLERDGFAVIRKFFNAGQLSELHRELDRYISEIVPILPPEDAFYQDRDRPETLKQLPRMTRDPYFDAFRNNAAWQSIAEELPGGPFHIKDPQWFNKPPGTDHPTPPHQDNFYFCLKPSDVYTAWLSLDLVDQENGCLRFVPGSHRRGIRPHDSTSVLGFSQGISNYSDTDHSEEVPVLTEPGDLVVHHGETIHRADANRTGDRQRRAVALVYQSHHCQEDAAARERYLASLRQQHDDIGWTVNE